MMEFELPEFLEEETDEQIRNRMLDALPDDIDKSEGSFIWDSIAPTSIEFAKTAEWAREILRRGFTSTTFGTYLDLKSSERGLVRQSAVKAKGYITFTGDEGTIIPVNTIIATPSDNVTASIEFETVKQTTIDSDGIAVVEIEAVEAGSNGNVKPGAITIILSGITGVTAVTNENGTSGGFDEENDISLQKRILVENEKAEGAGNISDYISWAQDIPSVGRVLIEPLWNGDNTVRVITVDRNGDPASADLIQQVQEYLDPGQNGGGNGKAPIGAIVTVATVGVVTINIAIPALMHSDGYTLDKVKQNVTESLDVFLKSINAGDTIRIKSTAAAIIQTPGVLDYGDLTLNGSRENITLSATEVAELGSVTFS